MARGNFMQNSFLSGEWAPFSQGKMNVEEYYSAVNLSLNFISTDSGATARRSGSRFSAYAKQSTTNIQLVDFVSETLDSLIVELTASTARFHRAGRLLSDSESILVLATDVSTATPAVVTTATAHGWSTGDTVIFEDLADTGLSAFYNNQYTITVLTATTFSLANSGPNGTGSVDGSTTGYTGVLVAVRRVTERTLPYTAAQVPLVKYTTEADTLYLFQAAHEVRTIDRLLLAVTERELLDGPYLDENETATTLGFSGTTGSITVTASSIVGINGGAGFQSTDVGRAIRVNSGTSTEPNWTWLAITAVASTTSVTATIRGVDLAATAAVTTWRLGVYSDTTGWPVHGVVHEGRLWLVGTSGRVDGSKTFDFFNFEPTQADGTVADDNGVSGIFAGSGRQNPQWLRSIELGLLVGTDGGEYLVRASSFDDPITPFTLQVRKHTEYGSSSVLPVGAGRNTVFVQSVGRYLMEYRVENSSLDGNDLARDARHLTSKGLIDLAYSASPIPTIWALRGDNRLLGITYRDDIQGRQVAWHRHSLAYGADVALGEDAEDRYLRGGQSRSTGQVYTLASAPFSDAEASRYDTLWVAVLREGTVCIEYLTPVFDETFLPNEAFLLDGGNIYRKEDRDGTWEILSTVGETVTARFYGLNHLAGKEVGGLFRGANIGLATVNAAGYVDFSFPAALLTTAAAYEETPTAFSGTLTAAPVFKSEARQTTPTTHGFPPGGETIFTGEDGVRYYIGGGINAVGGDGKSVIIYNADTGVQAFKLTSTDAEADADAAGLIPPTGEITSAFNAIAFAVPETPYFIVFAIGSAGTDTDITVMYYRISDASALVLDGGYAGKEVDSLAILPIQSAGNNARLAGFISGFETWGANNTVPYNSPIGFVFPASGGGTGNIFYTAPSINKVLADTPITENKALDTLFVQLDDFTDSGVLFTATGPAAGIKSRGFLLPWRKYGSTVFMKVFQYALENPSGAYLTTNSALYPNGLVSSFRAYTPFTDAFAQGFSTKVGPTTVSRNSLFVQEDGETPAFPFPDEKFDFTDGVEGAADENYYLNPSVYPSDLSDFTKPWFVFFPRMSKEADDRNKIGIRVFEFSPDTSIFRQLDYAEASLYVIGTDVNADTNPLQMNLTWDRSTGLITVLVKCSAAGTKSFIVSEFGTFTATAADEVPGSHIDAIIGCPYTSRLQLLRPGLDAGARNGPPLAKTRRIDQFGLFLYRSGSLDVGADSFDRLLDCLPGGLDTLGRRQLFNGVKHDSLSSDYNFDNFFTLQYTEPVPGTVTAISCFLDIMDR